MVRRDIAPEICIVKKLLETMSPGETRTLHVVTPEAVADLDALRAEAACREFATDQARHAKGAHVAFMMTRSQKQALRNKGFDDDQISNMTPAKAHDLLGVK